MSDGFIGAGDLYISRYVGGVYQDYEGPFESDKFEITPKSEKKQLISKGRYTYGQAKSSVNIPQPTEVAISLKEADASGIALALFGTVAALEQDAGTLTAESRTVKVGYWKPLSKANLSGTITVTDGATPTPNVYVEGIDYILNKQFGWIKALPGGALEDDDVVKVSGAYDEITGSRIRGATNANVRARFKLDGVNYVNGKPVTVTVHEAVIAADSALDFLAGDFNTTNLPGTLNTPPGYDEPFTVDLIEPAVA